MSRTKDKPHDWLACNGELDPWESLPGIPRENQSKALRAIGKHGLVLYQTRGGEASDLDAMASHNAAAFAAWHAQQPDIEAAPAGSGDGNPPWVNSAVLKELAALREAKPGCRNATLNRVGLRLARLLPGHRDWLRTRLIEACEANGEVAYKGLKSVEDTINSAYGKADCDGPAQVPTPKRRGINAEQRPRKAPERQDFWSARPVLTHIRDFARSRMVGPWGTLGVVLVRAVCQLPPEVQLPATIGGEQSLNMLLALVGTSGEGKGGCEAVGRAAVVFRNGADEIDELPLGSGEGIAKSLTVGEDVQRHPVIFTASEIDSVAALFTRRGSTLEPELRKLYSGETLGFTNAQKHTRTNVAAHTYRACLITGVQPTRGTFLLNGADAGTPQRFLWLPVDDADAPDVTPPRIAPLAVSSPAMFGPGATMASPDRSEIAIPASTTEQMRRHRLDVLRHATGVDPLDGHRMLCRLKVAAALMILDGRQQISGEDWELAGTVLAMSDHTRGQVTRAGSEKARQANLARAKAEVERDEFRSASKLRSTKDAVLRQLKRAEDGNVKRSDLRRALTSDWRTYFDPAISELASEGLLHEVKLPNGTAYRGGER